MSDVRSTDSKVPEEQERIVSLRRRIVGKRIGLVGYIASIFISVLTTLVIVQEIVVTNDRKGCERRQPIFSAIDGAFQQAAATLPLPPQGIYTKEDLDALPPGKVPKEAYPSIALRLVLQEAHESINPRIVGKGGQFQTCDEAYPRILSFIK